MNTRMRTMRGLGAVLLLGGALLAAAPGATAATAGQQPAATTLTPPKLTEAKYFDPWVELFLEPSATADQAKYIDVLADGKQVGRTDAQQDAGAAGLFPATTSGVNVDTSGASPTATYTLVYEDAKGNKSAPSNGLVPVNEQPLPKPVMKSAVVSGDKATLTWEPIADDAASVTYTFFANGGQWSVSVKGGSTATVDRTISIDTGPTGVITQTLNPGMEIWAQASDSNGETSPYGNSITVTGS